MKFFLVLFILLFSFTLFSQIDDNFEDGDISDWTESSVGRWDASSDNPINGSFSLHHTFNNASADNDQISIPFGSFNINSETACWRFQVRYEYTPSSLNNWTCFLFSDQDAFEMLPSGNANGYAIGVNYFESDDIIKIWKITGGVGTEILNTGINWETVIGTSANAGFEIKRTTIGEWTIYLDEDGGFDNLIQIGSSAVDTEHTSTNFIGFHYEYTSSQDMKLWIDDCYSGSEILDTEPPQILSLNAISDNTLIVNFNENLLPSTAENILNFSVGGSIGNPNTATLNPFDNKQVELIFTEPFIDGNQYTLTVNNVEDLSGNPCTNETGNFSYTHIAVVGVTPVSENELDVFFNKSLDIISAEIPGNYSVNNGINNPVTASVDGSNDFLVHLNFSNNFILGEEYTITVSNVEDTFGNVIFETNIDFSYYEVQPYDIVINEIMCDVNPPPNALPVHEYIELYNNSDYAVNFTGWTLKIGDNSDELFPAIILAPHEYAIICEDIAFPEFEAFALTIPILNPSELTVSGKRILIKSGDESIIEDVSYSDEWYDDDEKDGGGWSIERIDPLNFCGEDDNWTVTTDYTGGTPGRINSVYAVNPDIIPPEITELEYISSKKIRLHFSENLEILSAETITNYLLNSSVNPAVVVVSDENSGIADLYFSDNFNIGINSLHVQNIEDNCNNVMFDYQGTFDYQLIYPVSAEVMSENQLRIHFSETVENLSAQNLINYSVNKGIGNPQVAIISNTDSTIVNLLFDNTFILGEIYIVAIENVKDINNNSMDPANLEFVYYIPESFDIIINEILCDINPAPEVIPEARFVELYNTSSYDITLSNWVFISEGQSERIFPYITLHSDDYLILCESGNAYLFEQYGDVLPILTSSDIIASGKNLKLISADNTIIEEVDYSDEWYDDNERDDGGWSLERIDPLNFCGENDNWTVSEYSEGGGTPGRINSVYDENPDNDPPELLDVNIVSSNYLILEFSENISYSSGNDTLNFTINNNIGNPSLAFTDISERTKVHLIFQNYFSDAQDYSLMIDGMKDNCGNEMLTTGFDFTYHLIHPVELWLTDENKLKIQFSETVDFESGTNILNYFCSDNVGNPEFAFRESSDTATIHLNFSENFPEGEELILSLENIEDINGNVMDNADLAFTYYTPKAQDIVINEVLFNPNTGGSDFVEIYNRSEYDIDLSNIQLASRDDENTDSIVSISALSETNLIISPGSYMAYTTDREDVLRNYMSQDEENVFEIGSMPALNDDEGIILVMFKRDSVLDEFNYNEEMHFKLLDDEEGVSLERVNFNTETQDPSNWHSASEPVGFATPAYENSQFVSEEDLSDDPVHVDPFVFSPDNDGYDDYATIHYKFQSPGFVATVYIFDAKGRLVREIANNLLLSVEGRFVWDGLYADSGIAPAGTYLIYFKVFQLDGTVKLYKKTVVLAKRI